MFDDGADKGFICVDEGTLIKFCHRPPLSFSQLNREKFFFCRAAPRPLELCYVFILFFETVIRSRYVSYPSIYIWTKRHFFWPLELSPKVSFSYSSSENWRLGSYGARSGLYGRLPNLVKLRSSSINKKYDISMTQILSQYT